MALSVAKANEVARQLDREFNGAGDRMLASAARVLVPDGGVGTRFKLTDEDVAEMRAFRRTGASVSSIAEAFGVSEGYAYTLTAGHARELGEGPSSLASGTPNDGPSHPTTEPAA